VKELDRILRLGRPIYKVKEPLLYDLIFLIGRFLQLDDQGPVRYALSLNKTVDATLVKNVDFLL
jgi:hypothetical protein